MICESYFLITKMDCQPCFLQSNPVSRILMNFKAIHIVTCKQFVNFMARQVKFNRDIKCKEPSSMDFFISFESL